MNVEQSLVPQYVLECGKLHDVLQTAHTENQSPVGYSMTDSTHVAWGIDTVVYSLDSLRLLFGIHSQNMFVFILANTFRPAL